VHDIADLERRGVVGAFVASTEFIDAADAQARSLGVEPAAIFFSRNPSERNWLKRTGCGVAKCY